MSPDDQRPSREQENITPQHKSGYDQIILIIEEDDRHEPRAQIQALLLLVVAAVLAAAVTSAIFVGESLLLRTVLFLAIGFIAARVLLYLFP